MAGDVDDREIVPAAPCPACGGSGRVGLPRGMSAGFYAFMGPGCERGEGGRLRMVCPTCGGAGALTRPDGGRR